MASGVVCLGHGPSAFKPCIVLKREICTGWQVGSDLGCGGTDVACDSGLVDVDEFGLVLLKKLHLPVHDVLTESDDFGNLLNVKSLLEHRAAPQPENSAYLPHKVLLCRCLIRGL